MIKKSLLLLAASMFLAFVPVSCEEPDRVPPVDEQEQPEEKPEKIEALKGTVAIIDNMIFDKAPTFTMQVSNPNKVAVKVEVKMAVTTDKGAAVETWVDSVEVEASGKKDVQLAVKSDLAPGFYGARCTINKKTAMRSKKTPPNVS